MKLNTFLSTEKRIPYIVELHYKCPLLSDMYSIHNASDSEKLIRKFVRLQQLDLMEKFWVLLCSPTLHVLAISEISIDNTKSTLLNIPYILQLALLSHASSIVLAHNHPSGALKFSKEDLLITRKIKKALAYFDIKLLDHLIITSESYISIHQEISW